MSYRAIADAAMDKRLNDYFTGACRSLDRKLIEDAHRARRIRDSPKFLALVDLIDGADVPHVRGRRPERTAAAAALLDTAAIELEPDTTKRGAMTAAKVAVRTILYELDVDADREAEVIRQILDMARDWSRARAVHKARSLLHLRQGPRAVTCGD